MLIYGNHIEHLPLTSLRVIRGKSLNNFYIPRYATITPADRPTTTPKMYDDGGLKTDVWNTDKDYKDEDWAYRQVENDQTKMSTTTSERQDDHRRQYSLFVGSNAKVNSTTIGLKEIHLTTLRGQSNYFLQ